MCSRSKLCGESDTVRTWLAWTLRGLDWFSGYPVIHVPDAELEAASGEPAEFLV